MSEYYVKPVNCVVCSPLEFINITGCDGRELELVGDFCEGCVMWEEIKAGGTREKDAYELSRGYLTETRDCEWCSEDGYIWTRELPKDID